MIRKECSVDWCDRLSRAKGYCKVHYRRQLDGIDMDKPIRSVKGYDPYKTCSVTDCDRIIASKGLCGGHLNRMERGADLEGPWKGDPRECEVEGCDRPFKARNYCATHYSRWKNHGHPISDRPVEIKRPRTSESCVVPGCANVTITQNLCRNHYRYQTVYKLTTEQIIELWDDPSCGICGVKENLHLDHDHACCPGTDSCGKCVRKLLCRECNMGLGLFKDDVERLDRAADYLRRVA